MKKNIRIVSALLLSGYYSFFVVLQVQSNFNLIHKFDQPQSIEHALADSGVLLFLSNQSQGVQNNFKSTNKDFLTNSIYNHFILCKEKDRSVGLSFGSTLLSELKYIVSSRIKNIIFPTHYFW